jgi:hypothetical protein
MDPVAAAGHRAGLATTGVRRIGAWAFAGIALTQVAGGWLGQGTLYVLVLAGVWLVGRALSAEGSWGSRMRGLGANAAALAVVGAGLSAAVVWPRLQINPSTNLAGGYPGQSLGNWHGGWWPADWIALVEPGIWHIGAVPLALAVVALGVARRDHLTWLLGAVVAGALVLALPVRTPLNAPLLLVPGFDRILTHAPQRALLIAHPAVALLVGIAITRLWPRRGTARALGIAALVLLAGELIWANTVEIRRTLDAPRNPDLLRRIDPDTFYDPSGAGAFLQRQRDRGELGRYAAFTPARRADGSVVSASYFFFWHYPSVQWLEAHNESMLLGIEHVQGYNPVPVHLARYDDLITRATGAGRTTTSPTCSPARSTAACSTSSTDAGWCSTATSTTATRTWSGGAWPRGPRCTWTATCGCSRTPTLSHGHGSCTTAAGWRQAPRSTCSSAATWTHGRPRWSRPNRPTWTATPAVPRRWSPAAPTTSRSRSRVPALAQAERLGLRTAVLDTRPDLDTVDDLRTALHDGWLDAAPRTRAFATSILGTLRTA